MGRSSLHRQRWRGQSHAWAEERGAPYEQLIELPLGSVEDHEGIERVFTVVGLESYDGGLRGVNIVEGDRPDLSDGTLEVMLDEGATALLGWSLGESRRTLIQHCLLYTSDAADE